MTINKQVFKRTDPHTFVSQLPKIPKEPPELEHLLKQYSHLPTSSKPKVKRSKNQKQASLKRINAFIAFRSYYSKKINDSSLQRKLSKELARIWKSYPNQAPWYRYANEYTGERPDIPFDAWLHKKVWTRSTDGVSLGIEKSKWRPFGSSRVLLVVEDLFDHKDADDENRAAS